LNMDVIPKLETVLIEIGDGIGRLKLNRPTKFNAMSWQMF